MMRSALILGLIGLLFSQLLGQENGRLDIARAYFFPPQASLSFSDSVEEAWVARYHNVSGDLARALAVDGAGNVYVTGESSNGLNTDFATIKYSSDGNQLWVARYDSGRADNAVALVVDMQGGVYVTGSSRTFQTGSDYATLKYNSNGAHLWEARYDSLTDLPFALAVDNAGNVIVTGQSPPDNFSGFDYTTIKYSSSGSQTWEARYRGPGTSSIAHNAPLALQVDDLGNVYVTGNSPGDTTEQDYVTIKYDPSGVELWVARYNGPRDLNDLARALAVDNQGSVYVTGWSRGLTGDYDYATVKYDANGNQLWVTRYNEQGNPSDRAEALAVDTEGNVIVTGQSGGDYATVKYDTNGNEIWVARYDGGSAVALALDAQNNIYVTGNSPGSGTGNDYATVKYDANGNELWVTRYNGPGNSTDVPAGVALDNQGNVYVTGRSMGAGTNFDFATIKYVQVPTGVMEIPLEVPRHHRLLQNYPNPFNPITNIKFRIADFGNVELKIFDLLGREVKALVDKSLAPGSYKMQWDGTNEGGQPVTSGVYLYRLKINGFVQTRKLLLVR